MTEETKLSYSVNHVYREGYDKGRADAIDEFARKLVQWKPQNEKYMSFRDIVFQIAEKLKRGGKE